MPVKSTYICNKFTGMENTHKNYCINPFFRQRLESIEVEIGQLKMGERNPIRVQSMTTADTMDTEASVLESERMILAGCELVRLTAPSKKDALNLEEIHNQLRNKGYQTPLVADIHFTPNAAEIAAKIVEKVRVNPGNYADKKKFEEIEYTDESYQAELERIEEKFTPLVLLCKEHKTAMRIGTNHGSLSDRILSRYGDTAEGMVESAYEFLRICEKHHFDQIVISMKSSNALVMVQAYRLLAAKMIENQKVYPLHLGVTEAGDGEDGRIKSAVGIGSLLEDGLGDTIRVSLTEAPEAEIPVAQKLRDKYSQEQVQTGYNKPLAYNPFEHKRRQTTDFGFIGGSNAPVVVADLSSKDKITPANFFAFGYRYSVDLDKWSLGDQAADLVYIGKNTIDFEVPGTLRVLVDEDIYVNNYVGHKQIFPYSTKLVEQANHTFIKHDVSVLDLKHLSNFANCTLILSDAKNLGVHAYRAFYNELILQNIHIPVIIQSNYDTSDTETFQLYASAENGALLVDGFGDGLWINGPVSAQLINSTSFGILQATRTRISKTEYISCPSCGRTLFDLQETTAMIRQHTSHLKGVKIGIMGCIVNGPGEMADADYGYVGSGPGKITLYKQKNVVRKNVPSSEAVDELIELIKEHGDWIEPN